MPREPLNYFTKDPSAVLDYSIDWSNWLDTGETINTSSWQITEGGSVLAIDSDENNDTITTVWLSAGTLYTMYTVTNTIVTDSSPARTEQRSLKIFINNR